MALTYEADFTKVLLLLFLMSFKKLLKYLFPLILQRKSKFWIILLKMLFSDLFSVFFLKLLKIFLAFQLHWTLVQFPQNFVLKYSKVAVVNHYCRPLISIIHLRYIALHLFTLSFIFHIFYQVFSTAWTWLGSSEMLLQSACIFCSFEQVQLLPIRFCHFTYSSFQIIYG